MHLTIVLNPCLSGLRRLRTSSAPSLHSSGLSGGGPAERQRLLYQKSRRVEDCEVCICVCVCYVCMCAFCWRAPRPACRRRTFATPIGLVSGEKRRASRLLNIGLGGWLSEELRLHSRMPGAGLTCHRWRVNGFLRTTLP